MLLERFSKSAIRPSLRTLGRHRLPKRWHECCETSEHAPASHRRTLVRGVRRRENHHLRSWRTGGLPFEDFEPLGVAKRNADENYFS